jgi:hypothetical protein
MSLFGGDLTTPQRVANWMPSPPALPSVIINQLISSMTGLIYSKLNRARTYNQSFTRKFDGLGNMQIILPEYPVTSITSLQIGTYVVPQSVLVPSGSVQPANTNAWYGYRCNTWQGDLPGENATLDFANGIYRNGAQNIIVTYNAGYLVSNENAQVPAIAPYQITVLQQQGIWCRDNGVMYANGNTLTPVTGTPTIGQYNAPSDSNPGLYTFSNSDAGANLLISYSFIPAALEEACIQMIVERYNYRNRVGDMSKSLGGQETVRFFRGNSGMPWGRTGSLPPEVMDLIWPYVSIVPPAVGSPV